MTTADCRKEYRIVVVGDGGVGKTALVVQLLKNEFLESHDPTVEDLFRMQTVVDGEACVLDILDTGGQEEFHSMLDQNLRWGHGFLCVFAVDNAKSFQIIPEIRQKITRTLDLQFQDSYEIPIILVGNKIDLTRKVEIKQGEFLAGSYQCPYVETSAKTRVGVVEAFHALVREIRRSRRMASRELQKRRRRLRTPSMNRCKMS